MRALRTAMGVALLVASLATPAGAKTCAQMFPVFHRLITSNNPSAEWADIAAVKEAKPTPDRLTVELAKRFGSPWAFDSDGKRAKVNFPLPKECTKLLANNRRLRGGETLIITCPEDLLGMLVHRFPNLSHAANKRVAFCARMHDTVNVMRAGHCPLSDTEGFFWEQSTQVFRYAPPSAVYNAWVIGDLYAAETLLGWDHGGSCTGAAKWAYSDPVQKKYARILKRKRVFRIDERNMACFESRDPG